MYCVYDFVNEVERTKERLEFPWPDTQKPTFFYSVYGSEEIASSGTSFLNRAEAATVERIVSRFLQSGGVSPSDIGVITPYEGQRAFIVNYFKHQGKLAHDVYEVFHTLCKLILIYPSCF